jgi:electron transport complex protein RnfG
MNKIKMFLKESWLLIIAALLFAILLATVDYAWRPIIKQNQASKFQQKATNVEPKFKKFEQIAQNVEIKTKKGEKIKTTITRAKGRNQDETLGWAFRAQGSGFADTIKLVIVVDAEFEKILGYGILSSNETPGYGQHIQDDDFKNQFKEIPATKLVLEKGGDPCSIDEEIIAISGATVTSDAVVKMFNSYVEPVKEYLKQEGHLK